MMPMNKLKRYLLTVLILLFSCIATYGAQENSDQRLNPMAIQKLYQHPASSSYRFMVTGDNRDGDKIFVKILEDSQQFNPLFALHTGDFVRVGGYDEYNRFMVYLQSAPFPVIPALGNHDAYQKGRQWYNQFFGPSYFAFDYGADRFIILDNADGQISNGQLQWLEQQLQMKRRYKFVAMHKPPVNVIWFHAFGGDSATKMMDLVEKYHVNYVFCGHIHIYDKMVKNGVNYVVTGGAGAPLYQMPLYISPHGGPFNHYLLMEVNDKGIQETVVRLDRKKK